MWHCRPTSLPYAGTDMNKLTTPNFPLLSAVQAGDNASRVKIVYVASCVAFLWKSVLVVFNQFLFSQPWL